MSSRIVISNDVLTDEIESLLTSNIRFPSPMFAVAVAFDVKELWEVSWMVDVL